VHPNTADAIASAAFLQVRRKRREPTRTAESTWCASGFTAVAARRKNAIWTKTRRKSAIQDETAARHIHCSAELAARTDMRILPNPLDDGFNRLQALLLDMRAGDTLRIGDAVRQSGLSEDVCRSALEALTQIGLMAKDADDRFIRLALRRAAN
jgi:hypothetical protein